jgi:glutamate racemase
MRRDAHIIITDSGLGGLSICAALEQGLRLAGPSRDIRLTYVNAWPFEDRGYNDLPDEAARAQVFDAALARMAQMQPGRILIACNTLSILYPLTAFSRHAPVPVHGIVDAGTDLFAERLAGDPVSSIVLLGTRTTIDSGVHRERLQRRGVDPGRIAAVSCHGLAGAIERDVHGPRVAELIGSCASRAAEAAPPGGMLFLGLCCTHYGYVAVRLVDAVARQTPRRVRALDPNLQLTAALLADSAFFEDGADPEVPSGASRVRGRGVVSVELVSKVTLADPARGGIARLIEPVSAATAGALLSYAHVPDLF